jgi:hypothetical protein
MFKKFGEMKSWKRRQFVVSCVERESWEKKLSQESDGDNVYVFTRVTGSCFRRTLPSHFYSLSGSLRQLATACHLAWSNVQYKYSLNHNKTVFKIDL